RRPPASVRDHPLRPRRAVRAGHAVVIGRAQRPAARENPAVVEIRVVAAAKAVTAAVSVKGKAVLDLAIFDVQTPVLADRQGRRGPVLAIAAGADAEADLAMRLAIVPPDGDAL